MLWCARLLVAVSVLVGMAQGQAAPIPVVFVHGNGDDSAKWIGVMWLWESNGYAKDRLYSIRFLNPSARTDDTKPELFRSSTEDEAADLSAFVTRVLIQTHSSKVALVGSSRGGMTIRNYLEHGGAANVAYAVLCGTPNHGVMATDVNLNGEFNGKGPYLQALNHVGSDAQLETVAGVKMMTLRSDTLDKYAQPTGVGLGQPDAKSGVTYEGPALRGAENVVLPGMDHRELAFQPKAFAEMYRFITGSAPKTLTVTAEAHPVISGLVTGYGGITATNVGVTGVPLRVFAVSAKGEESTAPVYEVVTGADGQWGPVTVDPAQEYEFDLEVKDAGGVRHVRYYKAPIPRSTALLNLRLQPAPKVTGLAAGPHVFVERPQAYVTRERDPILMGGAVLQDEPSGLPSRVPVRDSFVAAVPNGPVVMKLRGETIAVRGSEDFGKDLPVVDFLW
jgi:triacylglycerol lipase